MTHFSEIEGGLLVAEEFVAAAGASGIKPEGLDTMLLHSRLPASAAATITTNAAIKIQTRATLCPQAFSRTDSLLVILDGIAQPNE